MKDYKNWKYENVFPNSISGDNDTIDTMARHITVEVKAPSQADMEYVMEWLALYSVGNDESEITDPRFQAFLNVIAFLDMTIDSKMARKALNAKKREYAEANGISVRQVRVIKKAG